MNNIFDIFFFPSEQKDFDCLLPMHLYLKSVGYNSNIVGMDTHGQSDLEGYSRFYHSEFPIAVMSSSWVLKSLLAIRPFGTFHSVNMEHGIAPFKKYTVGHHLLEADIYLAPTQLWAERLRRLYPADAKRIRIGGFPRLDALRDLRSAVLAESSAARSVDPRIKRWVESGRKRKLIILSWGTNAEELDKLLDQENIAYIYHPADKSGLERRMSNKCTIISSSPRITNELLCYADCVFGDFSSLTLEAISLNIRTYLFIDRNFYCSDCDMGEDFFDRESDGFGKIPETHFKIDKNIALDRFQLAEALISDDVSLPSLSIYDLPEGILPPTDMDNCQLAADIIVDFAETSKLLSCDSFKRERFDNVMFIRDSYLKCLGRPVDLKGLLFYIEYLESDAKPSAALRLEFLAALARSPEALGRLSNEHL